MITIENNQTVAALELTAADAKLINALRALSNTRSVIAQLSSLGLHVHAGGYAAQILEDLEHTTLGAGRIECNISKADAIGLGASESLELIRQGIANALSFAPISSSEVGYALNHAQPCEYAADIPAAVLAEIAKAADPKHSEAHYSEVHICISGAVWASDGCRMAVYDVNLAPRGDRADVNTFAMVPVVLAKALAAYGLPVSLAKRANGWLLSNTRVAVELPESVDSVPNIGRIVDAGYAPTSLDWVISAADAKAAAKGIRVACKAWTDRHARLGADLEGATIDLVSLVNGRTPIVSIPAGELVAANRLTFDPLYLADLLESLAALGGDHLTITQLEGRRAIRGLTGRDALEVAHYLMPIVS